jgi:hypothetical protein
MMGQRKAPSPLFVRAKAAAVIRLCIGQYSSDLVQLTPHSWAGGVLGTTLSASQQHLTVRCSIVVRFACLAGSGLS